MALAGPCRDIGGPSKLVHAAAHALQRPQLVTRTQNLSIWNWRTWAWISLGSRSAGTTEAETSVAPTGMLADYVSGSTGSGDVAVLVRCSGSYSSSFTSSADLLQISHITP